MIGNLLNKEKGQISILWIPSQDTMFEKNFKTLNYSCCNLDNLFLGKYHPNLIITNNKLIKLDHIINLCLIHYCNLIVIDHEEQPDIVSVDKITAKLKLVPNVLEISMSDRIYNSWGKRHDVVCKSDFQILDLKEIIDKFAEKLFIL
jgi:hypothetical protein